MALTNFTDLKASVADYLNRSDLTSVIPDFITMTESEMNRLLRVREMSIRTRAALDTQYLQLPVDYLGMRNIELLTSPVTPLEYLNPQNIDLHRRDDPTGKPIFYTILQNNLEFAPVPDTEYTLEIIYYQKIPSLATFTTNWMMDNNPDAYLYGALMQSAPYLHADERIQVWAGKFQQILGQIITSDENARFSGATPVVAFNPLG